MLSELKDPHSVLLDKDFLYVVSTGTDSVLRYKLINGKVCSESEIVWTASKTNDYGDTHHLNAITKWRSKILISAFGPKEGLRWSTAKKGYILDINTGSKIIKNIYHPHSIFAYRNKIFYCESSSKSLKTYNQRVAKFKTGYTRGLIVFRGFFIVGLSSGRKVSKSTGLINNIADPGELIPSCKVVFLKRNFWGDKIIPEKSYLFDFDKFHKEIYDLIPLDFAISNLSEDSIIDKKRVKKRRGKFVNDLLIN